MNGPGVEVTAIRDTVALLTGAMEPKEPELDRLLESVLGDVRARDGLAVPFVIGTTTAIVRHLIERAAVAELRDPVDLWREIAGHFSQVADRIDPTTPGTGEL